MITLITGQPGAGKTLRSLYEVNQLADREGRTVYYSGIKDLKLPWVELDDAADWWKCPVGSIIVIDECQRVFRPRSSGSGVPEAVSKMETHRHQGLDLFLITQHPMLLDSNIRRLCGRHVHVMRAFGARAANLHEWGEVREQCDKNRSGSVQTFWRYPVEVFNYYESAELHTHKLRLPPRVVIVVLLPFVIAGLVYWLYGWWQIRANGGVKAQSVVATASGSGPVMSSSSAVSSGSRPASKSTKEYIEDLTPRLPGLAHTAPAYDSITTPVEAPIPVGCMVNHQKNTCRCVDQQGNTYHTVPDTCERVVKYGLFISWKSPTSQEVKPVADTPKGSMAVSADNSQNVAIIPWNPKLLEGSAASVPASGGSQGSPVVTAPRAGGVSGGMEVSAVADGITARVPASSPHRYH